MKKVIATAAGLMLVGTMVGSASAAVSFSGDARARALYQSNYDLGKTSVDEETGAVTRNNEADNLISSRVRVQARGEAPGGAYAIGRLGIGNGTWDGGNSGTNDVGVADKAYIGVPMGMTLLEAGRTPTQGLESTKFFEHDITRDGARLFIMPTDMVSLELAYYINYEAAVNGDNVDDNDITVYGAWADAKFAGDWGTRFGVLYSDDQVIEGDDDADGAYGGIEFMGPAGPIAVSGAVAFDDRGEDTGWGAFLMGGMQFGATSVALNAGFAQDGFVTDGDFGFIMLGGGESITLNTGSRGRTDLRFGAQGDTWWVGVPVSFAVSEMLTLKGNLAYADMDEFGEAFEISGSVIYAISDGASVDLDIGYLAYSEGDADEFDSEESPFGAGLTFNVSF